ncbi:MAG: DUF748 domain-containing protein [Burkholderiales bacterium]
MPIYVPRPSRPCGRTRLPPAASARRSSPVGRERQHGRIARGLAWGGLALVLLLGALLAALTWGPNLVRDRIARYGGEVIGREVGIGRIDVWPFAGRLVLSGLSIASNEPGRPMVSVPRTTVEVDPLAYLRGKVVVRGVQLDGPKVRAVRTGPKRFDFSEVIERFENRPASQRRTVWQLDHVGITDGMVSLEDRIVRKTSTLDIASFALRGLTNDEDHVDPASTLDATMRLDGRPVVVKARATPFAGRPAGDVDLRVDALPLVPWLPYLPLPVDVRPASGALDVDLRAGWRPSQPPAERAVVEGRVAIGELSVRDAAGRERIGVDAVEAKLAPSAPLGGTVRLTALAVRGLRIDDGRTADGAFEWPSGSGARYGPDGATAAATTATAPAAVPPAAPSAASSAASTATPAGPRALRVDALTVDGARLVWRDATLPAPLELRVEPLKLVAEAIEIADLSKPTEFRGRARLDATVDGSATLAFEATLDGAAGRGEATLANLDVARYAPLAGPALRARVERGTLGARASLAWNADGPTATVTDSGAELAGLRIVKDGSQPAEVDTIALAGLKLDPAARTVEIGSAKVAGARIAARRDREGRIDLLDWYVPAPGTPAPAASPSPASAPSPSPPWAVRVASVELASIQLDYDDALIAKDRKLPRGTLNAKATELTLDPGARVPFEASVALADGSRLSARGALRPAPLDLDAQLRLQRLTVTHFDPYLEPYVNVALASGQLWSSGRLRVSSAQDGTVSRLGYDGELSFNEFRAIDKQTGDDFLRWSALALPSVKIDWRPARPGDSLIEIGAVAFVDFYARIILGPDGRLNLAALIVDRDRETGTARRSLTEASDARPARPAAPASATTAAAPTSEEREREVATGPTNMLPGAGGKREATIAAGSGGARPTIRVGTIRIASGNVNFTDLFIRPNYTANLTQLVGSIDALASDRSEPSDVLITGRVDDDTPLEITGKIAPLAQSRYLDLRAVARGFDLPKLSPYSGRWAGYAIEKGKLTADVRYRIEGDRLAAENKLVINQLTFGEKVESPDATSLPVRFAVSLLKDRNGTIDLDLPISGTISDPQFSVGGLLWRAIGNLIVKVVTSPFSFLASLGGGDAAELSHIAFPAGGATLDDEDRSRLDALARALESRPELSIEIAGVGDPDGDRAVMQRDRLERALRGAKLAQLRRANPGGELPALSEVKLEDAERPQLLERAWRDAKLDAGSGGKVPTPDELERALVAASPVATEEVKQIAQRRAQAARDYLRDARKLADERLFLLAPRIAEPDDARPPARTDFSVK